MGCSDAIEKAKTHFAALVKQHLERVERLRHEESWTDFSALDTVIIGVIGGDGIGPTISREAQSIVERLLGEHVYRHKIRFVLIEGLTIENRAARKQSVPDDVLAQIKGCHVLLKGPTHTPERGDAWPNLESANVVIRKELDLFANVRPVRIPREGIDWVFFRENTEDLYAAGSSGIAVSPDLAFDFRVATRPGSERIIEAAFAHAARTRRSSVTVVTKANVVKTTDGVFLDAARSVAKRYPGIRLDAWYVDIISAKLLDPKRRRQFEVLVMPNLYGDILTDEAAEIQGGVGTAGSANLGKRYAMFEAIHGSAPRMVEEGRAQYADPSSLMRAAAMMLDHVGFGTLASRLEKALDICGLYERKVRITGRGDGATAREFGEYLMATLGDSSLAGRWQAYVGEQAPPR